MSYIVLARKYRPRQFSELVGQQHIAHTLTNAFKQNKLGQAYLLTGTRGVGKTSVARIFAKALRCEDKDSQPGGKHPGIACDKCPSCLEINNGSSLDVLEIDGASNNGVENVREVREQVKFLPSRGRMKVYIIDEVHMLTNAAFNALLKTLEEPPPHVTFLLATTEVQKIPATILSRCQRFDFRRVPQTQIAEHLAKLSKLEGIKAAPAAIRLIAKKAEGSVRDALSSLDQCLALGGTELTIESVSEALGIVSETFLVKVLNHTFKRELVEAAAMVQEAFLGGIEMKQIAISLSETLRNALFVKFRADASLTELSPEERAEYEELVQTLSPETIQAAYRAMTTALEEILRSPLPKASLEMALARLAGIGHLKSLEELLRTMQNGTMQLGSSGGANASRATPPSAKAPVAPPSFAEKKSPSVAPILAPPGKVSVLAEMETAGLPGTPAGPVGVPNFEDFVKYVLQQKPSLGALLEHALPLSDTDDWAKAESIRLGFRKSHSFYLLQAQHKTNFEQLQTHLRSYTHRAVRLALEAVAESEAKSPVASMREKEKTSQALSAADAKTRFLSHEIVKNTKEIFGAELSSFDIDKAKS
ncbi:MAG: DNA polymerase III subunit gamma/tau [Bacteriovoracia bacterium]